MDVLEVRLLAIIHRMRVIALFARRVRDDDFGEWRRDSYGRMYLQEHVGIVPDAQHTVDTLRCEAARLLVAARLDLRARLRDERVNHVDSVVCAG